MVIIYRLFVLIAFVCLASGCGPRDQVSATGDSPLEDAMTVEESGDASPRLPTDTNNATATEDSAKPPANAEQPVAGATPPVTAPTIGDETPGTLPAEDQWKSWSKALRGGTPEERSAAASALAETLGAFETADVAGLLSQESVFVRRCVAFYLLERFEPNDQTAATAMIGALSDEDPTVRHIALSAIRRLPESSLASAVPQLTTMLTAEREDAANRAAIVRLVGSVGRQGQAALPRLSEVLQGDSDATVRSAAAVAIPRIVEPERAAVALQDALEKESDLAVKSAIVVRLARLGPASAGAVDLLADELKTDDHELQRKVIDALIAIGKPSVPQLIVYLEASDVQTRRLAVFALGSLSAVAAEATEPLKRCLKDEDTQVRQLAEVALLRIQADR